LGLPLRIKAEVDEGVVREGAGHEDVAAVAAVSSGRASAGDEFFAAEGHAAIAAVASLDTDSCFINKHRNYQCNRRIARSLKRAVQKGQRSSVRRGVLFCIAAEYNGVISKN
jgi:hypothetical protein